MATRPAKPAAETPAMNDMWGAVDAPASTERRADAPSSAAAGDPAGAGTRGYTVLARRYRSRGFDEIVGQESISRTLRNAIAQHRIAHAYLFCGTRGVGKTSMARIFAADINVHDQAEAASIRDAILRGQDMDVIEIDGASNRGIDDARDLIAAAGIAPARSPCKIYIIDEVHMLTTPAFNALLKTMEEPPPQVKFILCTTEPHKVPATIQSRCQRFDFRAIPASLIADHLRRILAQESIEADEEVLLLIARHANGSMRDALSLADRLIAASEGSLTRAVAEEVLGLPDEARVADLIDAIRGGDARAALERSAKLLEQGISIDRSLELLADRFRTILLARLCGADSALLELGADERRRAAAQAEGAVPESLVHHIAVCDAAARHARLASSPRTILDATIVRLALADRFVSAETAAVAASPKDAGSAPSKAPAGLPAADADKGPAPSSGAAPRRAAPAAAPRVEPVDEKKKPRPHQASLS